jgi:adenosylmethionine-8-amino-7-oxononanoate aminotransferase
MYTHGITFAGHPVMSAIALKNLEIMRREGIVEHFREQEERFRATLSQLLDLPIAGDARHRVLLLARARQGQGDA